MRHGTQEKSAAKRLASRDQRPSRERARCARRQRCSTHAAPPARSSPSAPHRFGVSSSSSSSAPSPLGAAVYPTKPLIPKTGSTSKPNTPVTTLESPRRLRVAGSLAVRGTPDRYPGLTNALFRLLRPKKVNGNSRRCLKRLADIASCFLNGSFCCLFLRLVL
jgi:hypothetical protein